MQYTHHNIANIIKRTSLLNWCNDEMASTAENSKIIFMIHHIKDLVYNFVMMNDGKFQTVNTKQK